MKQQMLPVQPEIWHQRVTAVQYCDVQVSAVKQYLAEAKQGLRKVETEIMVATGVQAEPPAAAGRGGGDAVADAATHQDFSQLMSAFHESAATNLQATEVLRTNSMIHRTLARLHSAGGQSSTRVCCLCMRHGCKLVYRTRPYA
jgi:hypothetical protein